MAHPEALAPSFSRPAHDLAPVRRWLLVVAALVFVMVSIGGATRLTGSGLSITEWKPIMGALPPLSDAAWQEAFEKYRQIPQYSQVNRGMSLEAFKFIFWWEWTHRFLGRLVGVVFLVPFVYFIATGLIGRRLIPRLTGIFLLGGLQGAVGWYMVSSGLVDRISVSQYRLALHLGLAILILGALIWVALSLRDEAEPTERQHRSGLGATLILILTFVQVLLGALVAGLKAGLAYNTWPLMDGKLVPDGLGIIQPWYLNLFENAMTVQFNHRLAAYILLGAMIAHAYGVARAAPHALRSALILLAALVAQAGLGIWTLLAQVPLALGLAHQAGAAAVFAIAVWHLHVTRRMA